MTAETTVRATPGRRGVLVGAAAIALVVAAGGAWRLTLPGFEGPEMTPVAALSAVQAGEVVLIDIRRPDEWATTGVAEDAVPIDLRRDDFTEAVAAALGGDRSGRVALICARGVRSDRMSLRLAAAGFTEVIDVPEGMLGSAAGPGWIGRGLPVTRP